jgi:hypothetical protein
MKDIDLIIDALECALDEESSYLDQCERALAIAYKLKTAALKVVHDEICYKSTADDQSYGMWCPVGLDHGFPEGTMFVRVDN